MANVLSRVCLADTALSDLAELAKPRPMVDLSEKYEFYAARFRLAMEARKLTNEVMSERMEAHPVTISKLRGGKLDLTDEWRARIAAALQLPEEVLFGTDPLPEPRPWEIHKQQKRGPKIPATNKLIPVFGLAAGSLQGHHSMTNEPVTEVPCPPGLRDVHGAYALETRGESMIPRFYPGERLYVNPTQLAKPGDYVIIQTMLHDNSGTETWVKRLDGENDKSYLVSQHNPEAKIEFRKRYTVHIHRVLPINELF